MLSLVLDDAITDHPATHPSARAEQTCISARADIVVPACDRLKSIKGI